MASLTHYAIIRILPQITRLQTHMTCNLLQRQPSHLTSSHVMLCLPQKLRNMRFEARLQHGGVQMTENSPRIQKEASETANPIQTTMNREGQAQMACKEVDVANKRSRNIAPRTKLDVYVYDKAHPC